MRYSSEAAILESPDCTHFTPHNEAQLIQELQGKTYTQNGGESQEWNGCAGKPVPPVAVADPTMHAPMWLKGVTRGMQRSQQQLASSLSNYSYMHHPAHLQRFNAMLPGCTSVPAFVPVQGSSVRHGTLRNDISSNRNCAVLGI